LLKPPRQPKPEEEQPGARIGRPARVLAQDLGVLQRLYQACDFACGKRLVTLLPQWLAQHERQEGAYPEGQKPRILSLSAATLDRHLRPVRRKLGVKGRCGTRPGSLLKTQILTRCGPWNEELPGFLEMDTVAHCGSSMRHAFVWTLTTTDIATGWTECRGVWNKQVTGIIDSLQDIDTHLPFTIQGLDCDNGSEFINRPLLRYVDHHPDKPIFTRSRPYRKNDNAHVEQKNWTHVRRLWGYARIDNRDVLDAINDLYRNEVSWMHNLFMVHAKLIEKTRVGSKIRRRHDTPKTPLQRLLESGHGDPSRVAYYQNLQESLNPFELRDTIQRKIRDIITAASATLLLRQ